MSSCTQARAAAHICTVFFLCLYNIMQHFHSPTHYTTFICIHYVVVNKLLSVSVKERGFETCHVILNQFHIMSSYVIFFMSCYALLKSVCLKMTFIIQIYKNVQLQICFHRNIMQPGLHFYFHIKC